MRTALYAGHHDGLDDHGYLPPLFAAAVRRVRGWQQGRRAARELSQMSDAMLRDIGLERGDVDEAVRHGRPNVELPPRG